MPGQPTPPIVTEAFAKNADPAYIQSPIPVTTADPKRASFDLGFPPLTMTEIFAGGNPPYGQDVNGILNMLSAHIVAAQAGQPYLFSATLAAVMSGYAAGAVVGMADGSGLWLNNVAGNSTDPDGGGAAGWVPLSDYGFAPVSGLTGGPVTLSRAQYRRGVLVLSGTLTSNLQVILPTGVTEGLRSWLVVNNCTGAFSVTAKTVAGTGVAIPAGGFAGPTEVYGDGTNIYPTVAPITLPTDIAPTPNTIPLRTNAGYLFATYFNQNSPLENFTITAMYADAGDGFHRKISLANMAAQVSLSQFAGQVVAGQVPAAAVTQYSALILANAALTGVPTAPTAALSTSNTQVATTGFANPRTTLAIPGDRTAAGGFQMRWGSATIIPNGAPQDVAIVFSPPFANQCIAVLPVGNRNVAGNGQAIDGSNFSSNYTTSGAVITVDAANSRWIAFGW